MKKRNYIYGLLLCLFFFSCEKEEFTTNNNKTENEGEEFYINPEDTADIDVPEGYSLVLFPGNTAMTRAGSETRIQNLQYIIYQKDKTGNYIQFYDNRRVNTDLSSWPVKTIAITLPKDNDYKVVFLGNVDKSIFGTYQTKEVLTGTGKGMNYTDARIILPNIEFSNNNMYFFAKADFNTNAIAYVPITLKRIVSRNDITKEGLSAEYVTGVTNDEAYKTAYWTQTIKEVMKESIFTGENSTFKYQVAEGLKAKLIYPFIYIGLAKPEDAATLAPTYSAVAKYITEWDSYKPTPTYTDLLDGMRKSYSMYLPSGAQYSNNVLIRYAQYLYDTFITEPSKDPQAVRNALDSIFNDNIMYVENHFGQLSIDKAVSNTVTAFKTQYTSGPLLPWKYWKYNRAAIIDITPATPLPGAVNFDLNIDEAYNISGEKYYQLRSASNYQDDKYISIISLGNSQTSGGQLNISGIDAALSGGTSIDYVPETKSEMVGNGFTAGNFHRNIRSVTTMKIRKATLANPKLLLTDVSYQQKIEINYYHMFQAMNPKENGTNFTLGNTAQTQFTVTNIPTAIPKLLRIQSYILNWLNNNKYIQMEYQDYKDISFPFATFVCPDVSPANINVQAEWSTEEIE